MEHAVFFLEGLRMTY